MCVNYLVTFLISHLLSFHVKGNILEGSPQDGWMSLVIVSKCVCLCLCTVCVCVYVRGLIVQRFVIFNQGQVQVSQGPFSTHTCIHKDRIHHLTVAYIPATKWGDQPFAVLHDLSPPQAQRAVFLWRRLCFLSFCCGPSLSLSLFLCLSVSFSLSLSLSFPASVSLFRFLIYVLLLELVLIGPEMAFS